MNIDSIQNGVVLDHIQAGKSMDIYRYLHLDQLWAISIPTSPSTSSGTAFGWTRSTWSSPSGW